VKIHYVENRDLWYGDQLLKQVRTVTFTQGPDGIISEWQGARVLLENVCSSINNPLEVTG